MRPFILPISIFVLLAGFFSCTIEKRLHRSGYHIEWKKHPRTNNESPETTAAAGLHEFPASESNDLQHEVPVSVDEPRTIAPSVDSQQTLNNRLTPTVEQEHALPEEMREQPLQKQLTKIENTKRDRRETVAVVVVIVLILAMVVTAIWMFYAFFNPWGAYLLLGLAAVFLFLLLYSGGLVW